MDTKIKKCAKDLLAGKFEAEELESGIRDFQKRHNQWLAGVFDNVDSFEERLSKVEQLISHRKREKTSKND